MYMQKRIEWSEEKNLQLIAGRNISFQEIVSALEDDRLIATVPHHNLEKYPNQRKYIVRINGYVYQVPFVEDDEKIFLKTIMASRVLTKKYL